MHLMRVSPSVSHPCLQTFDSSLRSAIQRITNTCLSDTQWIQASLPIKLPVADGSLGVRHARISSCLFGFSGKHRFTPLTTSLLAACSQTTLMLNYFLTYPLSWSAAFGTVPEWQPTHQIAILWSSRDISLDIGRVGPAKCRPPRNLDDWMTLNPQNWGFSFLAIFGYGAHLKSELRRN